MKRSFALPLLSLGAAVLTLTACDQLGLGDSAADKTAATKAKKPVRDVLPVQEATPGEGTPMAQRVAVLGLLNKQNGKTRAVELKPGEAIRFGDRLVLRVRACERTAPWENYPDAGAFVQVLVNERAKITDEQPQWRRVFSGWLFKENPAQNVVQHPVYDVWVKDCKMRFPGEEEAAPAKDDAKTASNAPQSAPKESASGNANAAPRDDAPAAEPEPAAADNAE